MEVKKLEKLDGGMKSLMGRDVLIDKLGMEVRKYRLNGITPLLGSQPANPAVRSAWIASKGPDWARKQEDALLSKEEGQEDDHSFRVFLRDPENKDALFIYDYVVKGFFKAALEGLQGQIGVLQPASKVDKLLFVFPRVLYITREGEQLYEEDTVIERPLRAQTPKGPRVTLPGSETVLDPWEIELEIGLLPNKGTRISKAITWEAVEAALAYGQLNGLGNWRNASMGRFIAEPIAEIAPYSGRDAGGWAPAGT